MEAVDLKDSFAWRLQALDAEEVIYQSVNVGLELREMQNLDHAVESSSPCHIRDWKDKIVSTIMTNMTSTMIIRMPMK